MPTKKTKALLAFAAAAAFSVSSNAFAAGSHGGGHGHAGALDFGEPGKSSEVTRTIEITMGDNYFEPENLVIKDGETIRFVVKNTGDFLHEFNIGTTAMHVEHQKEMMTMMEHGMLTATGIDHGMMKMDHGSSGMSGHVHDDPNSVLVEPGKSAELVWKFALATNLEFACNVPGHYDAGMMGQVKFGKTPQSAKGS